MRRSLSYADTARLLGGADSKIVNALFDDDRDRMPGHLAEERRRLSADLAHDSSR